jgi:hypothetical protein
MLVRNETERVWTVLRVLDDPDHLERPADDALDHL